MKVCIYPKPELMATWSADCEQMDKATNPVPTCLRCGRPIDRGIANNAFSRALDVYVCASCGMEEAMEDYHGQYLRLVDWDAVRRARTIPTEEAFDLVLRPECTFRDTYDGPLKENPYSCSKIPVREIAYSRSDCSNGRWFTTWFHCAPILTDPELVAEIQNSMEALLKMPEFMNLRTFRRTAKLCAEPTSEPTEFNLYGESKHFDLWLRLITRDKDYNLYVHYLLKE